MSTFLDGFRWYRRWRGGVWFRVCLRPLPEIVVWINTSPTSAEIVLAVEDYTRLRPRI